MNAPDEGRRSTFVLEGLDDPDFVTLLRTCDNVLLHKGNDYTQGKEGEFGTLKSFYDSAEDVGIEPFQVLYVLLNKHLSAIRSFLKRGQVESEPIESRIVDAINYLFLLYKMIQVQRRKEAAPPGQHPV